METDCVANERGFGLSVRNPIGNSVEFEADEGTQGEADVGALQMCATKLNALDARELLE